MLSQLEQACKTYSTEFSCGLIEFDSDWQRIFVTALTFHLDQAIPSSKISNSILYTLLIKVFGLDTIFIQYFNKHSFLFSINISETLPNYPYTALLQIWERRERKLL